LIAGVRKGSYWAIDARVKKDYRITTPLDCPFEKTLLLAKIDTRLKNSTRVLRKN
jgi:hypothetical protein